MSSFNIRSEREGKVKYSYLGGVDFTGEHKSDRIRPVYMENLYRDYEGSGGDMLESIPGFRTITSCPEAINGLYRSDVGLIIHSGSTLTVATLENGKITKKREIGTLKNAKSRAFSVGKCVYILDGESITCINEDGTAVRLGNNGDNAYAPTTYYNGESYEQRNLLTDDFKEKLFLPNADIYSLGADGLYFRVVDFENKKCAVTGTNDIFFADYCAIPSYTVIGGERYSVVAIDDGAFRPGTEIGELHLGEGIVTIGQSAFAGCTSIKKIYFPRTLSEIKSGAFAGCSGLTQIYLWLGFEKFGENAFERCPNLTTVYYTGSDSDFRKITNFSPYIDKVVVNHKGYYEIRLELPLSKEAKSIRNVSINGVGYQFTSIYSTSGTVKSVIVSVYDKRRIVGTTACIEGSYTKEDDGLEEALKSCTVFEMHDGRVFLSGSKLMPGEIFYSEIGEDGSPNMQYFGRYNTFKDGGACGSVVAMVSMHDGLAVFCDTDTGGGIFYHSKAETTDNFIHTVYPVSYIHSGITARADAICFYDDPVFITDSGVYGLDMKRLEFDRSISCRSSLINPYLLTESLNDAILTRWKGYLVLAVGEHVYLGDSRGVYLNKLGEREYEWYYLSGIGTRKGAKNVYRYSSVAKDGFLVHPDCDKATDATVMSVMVDGEQYCYVEQDGKRYAVHKTEEIIGGTFYPLTSLHSSREDELFFGTKCGDVCIFNTDKRGIAPEHIGSASGFSDEEYKSVFGRKIHPYYYSFSGFAPTYAIKTPKDNCGASSELKNTVKNSLALTCKTAVGRIICEVGTDKRGYKECRHLPNSEVDFSYFDFESLSFSTSERITVPMSEKEKGWLEKQVAIYSKDFGSPFGISEIHYGFTVKGRIKKT